MSQGQTGKGKRKAQGKMTRCPLNSDAMCWFSTKIRIGSATFAAPKNFLSGSRRRSGRRSVVAYDSKRAEPSNNSFARKWQSTFSKENSR